MRDGPGCVFNGGFYWGSVGGSRRWGSSPRIRGKRFRERLTEELLGLIPAHTGKTRRETPCCCRYRAHPRAYGENGFQNRCLPLRRGSSPRIRGKPAEHLEPRYCRGLIPAHTGKTWSVEGAAPLSRAHPRAYGENLGESREHTRAEGSSPRIRGKLESDSEALIARGLIPAHTGKTLTDKTQYPRKA